MTDVAHRFDGAGFTPADMLFAAGLGFSMFGMMIVLFAIIGEADNLAKNLDDLRNSGWK